MKYSLIICYSLETDSKEVSLFHGFLVFTHASRSQVKYATTRAYRRSPRTRTCSLKRPTSASTPGHVTSSSTSSTKRYVEVVNVKKLISVQAILLAFNCSLFFNLSEFVSFTRRVTWMKSYHSSTARSQVKHYFYVAKTVSILKQQVKSHEFY